MGLIMAKCPNCGGKISLDNNDDIAECPYCHSQFYKEQAINNYNIGNIANVENMIIQGKDSIEQMIINADAYLNQLHDYDNAIKKYTEISEKAGNRYEGWWGLVKSYTKNLQYVECGYYIFNTVCDLKNRAVNVADKEIANNIEKEWIVFCNGYNNYVNKLNYRINEMTSQRNNLIEPIKNKQLAIINESDKIQAKVKSISFRNKVYKVLIYIIAVISIILLAFLPIKIMMDYTNGEDVIISKYKSFLVLLLILLIIIGLLALLGFISNRNIIKNNRKIYLMFNDTYKKLMNEILEKVKLPNMQIAEMQNNLYYGKK